MSVVARSWTLRAVGLLLVVKTLVLGFGCSGKSQRSSGDGGDGDDSGGTGGSSTGATAGTAPAGGVGPATGGSGTSGTAGTAAGGDAGTAMGGVSGDAGNAGSGVSGTGATAGEAGRPSTSPVECMTADDCFMASDCCGCRSEPIISPTSCPLDCIRDACRDMNIDRSEVDCIYGRCVIGRSCDRSRVTCPALPPNCGDTAVPSVVDDCWGPCMLPTDCSRVTTCDDCGDAFCVEFQALPSSYYCIERNDACNANDNYCGCMGIHCNSCSASDPGVICICPAC